MSNRDAKAALTSGKVYVSDAPTADAAREIEPSTVSVRANAPKARPWVDAVIVFRDDHLAVVAKPSGLLAVPAANRRGETSVLGVVGRALGTSLAVHRIDEATSGLMLVARSEACQLALKDLFFRHDIERSYVAVVAGVVPAAPVTHETILVRDRGDGLRGSATGAAAVDGKRAVSHVSYRGSAGPGRSVVDVRLETGRTHQIRIHLAELGWPILGDRLYAPHSVAQAGPRLALHAAVLAFRHPVTGQALRFAAPLADDLERLTRAPGPKRSRR